jgi:hypothetical protein
VLILDLASLIEDAGLGVWETDTFGRYLPDDPGLPDTVTTLQLTPGMPPTETVRLPQASERPAVQVTVRGRDYLAAHDRAHALYRLLGSVRNRAINGVRYARVAALQPPFELAEDGEGRATFAFNLLVTRSAQ